jgi:hypothetical protein
MARKRVLSKEGKEENKQETPASSDLAIGCFLTVGDGNIFLHPTSVFLMSQCCLEVQTLRKKVSGDTHFLLLHL